MSTLRERLALGLAAIALGCGDPASEPFGADDPAGGGATGTATRDAAAPSQAPVERIQAPDLTWQWVAVPESVCRDGSSAGFFVSLNGASKKVMIYLEGGGSCFDAQTCAGNPAAVGAQAPGADGVFDRANADNPVGDWNHVYVPYCSGDHHVGDARDALVPGVDGVQQFQGRPNLRRFLARLVPTFAGAEQVLLTGASAGGIGALMGYRVVQAAFEPTPVTLIDDSGPVLPTPACLNQLRRPLWGLDQTVLKDCGEHCDPDGGNFAFEYALYTMSTLPRAGGLLESFDDDVIRLFLGIASNDGRDDCKGVLGTTPLDAMQFEQALLDLRERLRTSAPRFGTFYPAGTQHVWITGPGFYAQTAGSDGVKLVDWFRAVLDDEPASHLGP